MNFDVNSAAKALSAAKRDRRLLQAFSSSEAEMSIETAYQIQQVLLEEALAAGETLVGFKMGLTSRAKQVDVGVFSAIHGFLLGSMSLPKGKTVDAKRFCQPRVEPEIAVILNKTFENDSPTLADVRSAVAFVGPAAEILDSRYEKYQFKLADVIADNTSASAFVLGSSNWLDDFDAVRLMGIRTKKNGVLVDSGAAAATFNDPLLSVLELVTELAKRGQRLQAGQVVLTGGVTASVPFAAGDFIELVWPTETISFAVS